MLVIRFFSSKQCNKHHYNPTAFANFPNYAALNNHIGYTIKNLHLFDVIILAFLIVFEDSLRRIAHFLSHIFIDPIIIFNNDPDFFYH